MNFTPIRLAGSVLSLVSGSWAAYIAYSATNSHSELQSALIVVGALLALDAIVSFAGIRASFVVGAGLSALVLVIVADQWGTFSGADASVALVVSLIAVVTDVVASRPVKGMSEQTNPMNLPVFG